MSLLANTALPPIRPASLADAVARARWPRNRATAQLEPHREELLRLRQAGESVESLAGGLRLMGIGIGHETLRRWLLRELGQRPTRRRKTRAASAVPVAETPLGVTAAQPPSNNLALLGSENSPVVAPAKTQTANDSMPAT